MQSIISQGKNIEEAIHLGLELLEVNKRDVDIEIIQQAKKGFAGLGRKQAIVKLSLGGNPSGAEPTAPEHGNTPSMDEFIDTFLESESPKAADMAEIEQNEANDTVEMEMDELAGKAWVKDSQIHVKDSPNKYATVKIGEGIQLMKNNELVTEKSTIVSERDHLMLNIKPLETQYTVWDVRVEKDKLSAILEVKPGFKVERRVRDIEPDEHIELSVEETKEVTNTLKYDQVVRMLENLRVIYGINHNEIIRAIDTTEPGTFEIATGKKAEPGKNGWIDLKVETDPMNGLIEDESGNVDFRETNVIPSVEKGTIIATLHDPIPGRPGITVTNEPLPAKQTHPLKVVAKNGIIEVDAKLVATESGRPSIEQRGQLVKAMILPKLVHQGNVDLASGNIRFNGDVEIIGEVEENMLVEAGGDVFIHKATSEATITTSKSIVVKGNVISSELSAGKNNMLVVELGHLLGIMHVQVEKMITVIKQLTTSPAFKSNDFSVTGLQPLIRILLEKKFYNFLPYVKQYQEVVEKGREYIEGEEWHQVGVSIKQIFIVLSNQVTTMERLTNLSQKMKELSDTSDIPVEPNSYITVSDTINSSLYCSGDINIIGKGCINTKVHAGGKLHVRGIVRGGEVYGRLGATIHEVGTNSGTKTIVAVPKDQKIQLAKAFEGTVLKIGKISYKLQEERKHITARLNDNDQIIFE
ncbi:flagellar assembly protein A [Oceanobacillus salinisoli]|uniref:flagellar assembly protein A n=1 Tax=Oceanobacillus salinisoli TaxID=2678611 RepID=UPI0012E25BB8|nr:FapA family protein [Oceanobacillus salinisoli]